jgi:predicted HNH restriction endonuclease
MSKVTFSSKWGKVKARQKSNLVSDSNKSVGDSVREMKNAQKPLAGEDYRERSLAIHGLVCARCGREFAQNNRSLLTVHHKDGNHHNNPADGSNWENLCAYCHEDVHSRGVLAEYLGNAGSEREFSVVYEDSPADNGLSAMAEKLKKALQKGNSS